ncbi:hypothetical protein L914_09943 [Phytophthora nicotianae]|uniref:Tf2-1-like SH3-like domain-containing protein n=1 Tax=Phytophthora nicotianae TaxID=4792 RepID=W2N8L6_PHYNI|nr:hypothetical protein L914_09943 [Phytophthora nicotianae]
MERFNVGDRVLLSTSGITPTSVTNLDANKLAPRFIGPFKILKVLGDAYILQLLTAIRLHPTFYVGRLRRYHPAIIPSDAANPPRPLTSDFSARRADTATDGASPDSLAPVPPRAEQVAAAPPGIPTRRSGTSRGYSGTNSNIVDRILRHEDPRAAPTARGARRSASAIPIQRRYLVHWLSPMPDSWEPLEVLLADVPD